MLPFSLETSDTITEVFVANCSRIYRMDHNGYHGIHHWTRVLHNGRLLTKETGANLKVVELFCLLHDTQRLNEDYDRQHGHRASLYAQSIRGVLLDATDAEMDLLMEACTYHSDGHTDGDITVQTCWDADRLDLGRVEYFSPHQINLINIGCRPEPEAFKSSAKSINNHSWLFD